MKALLIHSSGKKLLLDLSMQEEFHTEFGVIRVSDVKKAFGKTVKSHLGEVFLVLEPSVQDLVEGMEMFSRPIYPYDAAVICAMLDIRAGSKVLEVGTGSGGLTLFMARLNAEVRSYEREKKAYEKAVKNLNGFKNVDLIFGEPWKDKGSYDAIVLDMQKPYEAIPKLKSKLKVGGFIGVYTPIIDDIKQVWRSLEENGFSDIHSIKLGFEEIIVKKYARVKGFFGYPGFFIWGRKVKDAI